MIEWLAIGRAMWVCGGGGVHVAFDAIGDPCSLSLSPSVSTCRVQVNFTIDQVSGRAPVLRTSPRYEAPLGSCT